MKPVLIGEVVALARVLRARPEPERRALVERVVFEARAADRHMRLHHCAHPRFGNGTVAAAASRRPLAQEGFANDPEFCACLRCALEAVGMASARAQDTKRG